MRGEEKVLVLREKHGFYIGISLFWEESWDLCRNLNDNNWIWAIDEIEGLKREDPFNDWDTDISWEELSVGDDEDFIRTEEKKMIVKETKSICRKIELLSACELKGGLYLKKFDFSSWRHGNEAGVVYDKYLYIK